MANENIQVTVAVKGDDQVSATLAKVQAKMEQLGTAADRTAQQSRAPRAALEDIGVAAESTAEKTRRIAEKSGDLERGLRGVKDLLGSQLGGQLGYMVDAFGAVEGALKGFGPALGPVGIALGVAGGAAYLLYQHVENARKAAVRLQIEQLSAIQKDSEAMALRYGVSAQLLGVERNRADLAKAQAEAQQQLAATGQAEQAVLAARLENDSDKIAAAERALDLAKQDLSVAELRVAVAKRLTDEQKVQADYWQSLALKEQIAGALEDRRIATTLDKRERLRLAGERAARQQVEAEYAYAQAVGNTNALLGDRSSYLRGVLAATQQLAKAEQATIEQAAQGQAFVEDRRARQQAAAAAARARRQKAADAALQFERDLVKDLEDQERSRLDVATRALQAERERADAMAQADDQIRQAQIQMASDPAARYRLELAEAEIVATRELAAAKRDYAMDEERLAKRTQAIDMQLAVRRMALATQERQRIAQEREAKIGMALDTAKAAVAGLEQIGLAERASAGLKAIIAGAEAALAFTRGNYAAAAAGVFSAIQFGSIALGGTGRPLDGTPLGNGSSAMPTQTQAALPDGGAGGGGGPVVININGGVVGDEQTVGRRLSQTIKKSQASGWAQWQGA